MKLTLCNHRLKIILILARRFINNLGNNQCRIQTLILEIINAEFKH